MKNFIATYKRFFSDKRALRLTGFALLLLALSLIINYYAWTYASIKESNSVTDIILSNIRAFDVDALFVYATFLSLLGIVIYCIKKPFQIPYIVKSIALFVVIRSVFVTLTHVGPFPTSLPIDKTLTFFTIFSHFSFTWDLFFSGHTWLPFLFALILWDNKILRYVCIGISVFFAVIVLLWHYHYSIDVLSAFFITYGIYHLSLILFPRDKKHFDDSFKPISL